MKEWLSVKSVLYIKWIRLEGRFAIATNTLVQMVLNGVGLERMDTNVDVPVIFAEKLEIQKVIVL